MPSGLNIATSRGPTWDSSWGETTMRRSFLAEHRQGLLAEQADRREQADRQRDERREGHTEDQGLGLEGPRGIEHESENDPGQHRGQRRSADARGRAEARVLD